LKVAVYKTSSAGCRITYDLLKRKGYKATYVGRYDVEYGRLSQYPIAVFPGSYQHLFTWMESQDFRVALRKYVRSGGRFIGVCGGALLGVWLVNGLWHHALPNVRNGLYYAWYMLTGLFGRFLVEWGPCNKFGESGTQPMCWAGGPYIPDGFVSCARYAEDKWLLPFKRKTAIGYSLYGEGTVVLFGPHPEYLVDQTVDNSGLLLKALKLF